VFNDVAVGEVFGVRTLLDNITCQKYILQFSTMFAEQLQESPEEFYEHYKSQQQTKKNNKSMTNAAK
jgi:hypothetical protein